MPKLHPDPITVEAIEKYLETNDDFAFELRCLRELRKRPALSIAHGGTYSDPVTDKSRQFDFRIKFSPHERLHIAVALECKNLGQNFPLVVSRMPRLQEEAFHQLLVASGYEGTEVGGYMVSSKADRMMNASKALTLEFPGSPYGKDEMVGKSTVQVGRGPNGEFCSGDSEVYEKWAQAVSSAYELISNAHHTFVDDENLPAAFFVVPVVVIPDGTLWAVDYLLDGTALKPKNITETTFYLNHSPWSKGQMFSYTISHLHFVTLTGLGSFIDRHLVNGNFHRLLLPAE